eukprot:gene2104-2803_t
MEASPSFCTGNHEIDELLNDFSPTATSESGIEEMRPSWQAIVNRRIVNGVPVSKYINDALEGHNRTIIEDGPFASAAATLQRNPVYKLLIRAFMLAQLGLLFVEPVSRYDDNDTFDKYASHLTVTRMRVCTVELCILGFLAMELYFTYKCLGRNRFCRKKFNLCYLATLAVTTFDILFEEVTESCSSVGSWLNSIGRRPVASLAVVVVTQVFETGVHYIALLNAVALFVEGSTQSSTLQGVMQGFNALLLLCFGFEMLCRWSAIGLFALVRDWGMDLLVVVLSFASRADPDVYKYMMALQVTRVVTTHAALRGLVHTFKECLPMVLQMLTLGVCICYTYAAMGLEAFGTTVVGPRPYCNEKSPAPSSPPRSLHEEAPMLARPHHRHVSEDLCIDHIENFETPGHALLALFQIMTGNNWNDVMYPNALGSDISGASMYFISFYFIAVLLLINLMTSLILDIYISRNDLLDQRGENKALFVLLTTENFPDVFRPAYHLNVPIALVYFLSYFILGVWMLMSLLLAIIYSHYKEKHTDKMRRSQLSEQKSLLTAFIIMQDNGEPLSFRKWCALLKHVKPWATSEGLKVLFDSLDDDKDGCITIQEFFRVPEVLSYRLTRTLVQEEVTESCSSVGSWLNSIGRRPSLTPCWVWVATDAYHDAPEYGLSADGVFDNTYSACVALSATSTPCSPGRCLQDLRCVALDGVRSGSAAPGGAQEEVAQHEMKHLQDVLRCAGASSEGAWSNDVIEKLCSLAHHDWQQVSNVLAQQSNRRLRQPRWHSPSLSQPIAGSPGVDLPSDNGSPAEGLDPNESSPACDPSSSQRSNGGRGKALLAVGHAADVASDPLQKRCASYEPPSLLDYLEAPDSAREPLSPRELQSLEEGRDLFSASQPSSGPCGLMPVQTDPDRHFIVDLEAGDSRVSVSQPTTFHEKLKADPDQHLLTMEAGADSVDHVSYSSSQPSTPGVMYPLDARCRQYAMQREGFGVVDPSGPSPEPPVALELLEAAEADDADPVPRCAPVESVEEDTAVECDATLEPEASIHACGSKSTECESSSTAPQPFATSSSSLASSSSSPTASRPSANPPTSCSAAEVSAAAEGGSEAMRVQAQAQSGGSEPLEEGLQGEGSRPRGTTFPAAGARTPPAKRPSELSAGAGSHAALREVPQCAPHSISKLKLNFEKVTREPPSPGGSDSDFSDGIRRVIQPGEVLENRYLITRELESGASSRTFEAKVVGEGVQNSKLVSLKTVSLRDSSNWEVLDLFEEEARVLVDTEEDRVFCLVQCLTPGQTLEVSPHLLTALEWLLEPLPENRPQASIESGWRPTEREAVRICEELLELLGYLQ